MADRKTRPQPRFSVYEKEHPSKNTDRAFNSHVPKASKNNGYRASAKTKDLSRGTMLIAKPENWLALPIPSKPGGAQAKPLSDP